jgi:hypothetical protein
MNRHRRSPAVRALLPDLTTVARAASSQVHRRGADDN